MIDFDSWTRLRAYEIWESEGRPEGRALEHWLAAQATCRSPAKSRTRTKAPRGEAERTAKGTLQGSAGAGRSNARTSVSTSA